MKQFALYLLPLLTACTTQTAHTTCEPSHDACIQEQSWDTCTVLDEDNNCTRKYYQVGNEKFQWASCSEKGSGAMQLINYCAWETNDRAPTTCSSSIQCTTGCCAIGTDGKASCTNDTEACICTNDVDCSLTRKCSSATYGSGVCQ